MSIMLCRLCGHPVDTDEYPESLYVQGYKDKCVCEGCFTEKDLELEERT